MLKKKLDEVWKRFKVLNSYLQIYAKLSNFRLTVLKVQSWHRCICITCELVRNAHSYWIWNSGGIVQISGFSKALQVIWCLLKSENLWFSLHSLQNCGLMGWNYKKTELGFNVKKKKTKKTSCIDWPTLSKEN